MCAYCLNFDKKVVLAIFVDHRSSSNVKEEGLQVLVLQVCSLALLPLTSITLVCLMTVEITK